VENTGIYRVLIVKPERERRPPDNLDVGGGIIVY
jgi:hypothetical protein